MAETEIKKINGRTICDMTARNKAVQGDWSVNDENDPAYIKNRTHWVEDGVILPETTVEIDPEEGLALLPELGLAAGMEYTVIYNGTEYVGKCVDIDDQSALGNYGAFMDPPADTGEPFMILHAKIYEDNVKNYRWLIVSLDGSTSVTLSIKGEVTVKIPQRFIDTTPIISKATENAVEAAKSAVIGAFSEKNILNLRTIFGAIFDVRNGTYNADVSGFSADIIINAFESFIYSGYPQVLVDFDLIYDDKTLKSYKRVPVLTCVCEDRLYGVATIPYYKPVFGYVDETLTLQIECEVTTEESGNRASIKMWKKYYTDTTQ